MTDTIAKRIVQVRQEHDLSQSAMARKLGVAQSTISQIEAGNSTPSADFLMRLIDAFGVRSDWVLTGAGQPSISSQPSNVRAAHHDAFSHDKTIPLIDVEARAGYIESDGSDEFVETLERFKIPGMVDIEGLRIFEVDGDSMMPTFYPGDYVICEEIDDYGSIQKGTLGVVISQKGVLLKRLSYFDGAEDRVLILRSDNEIYKPQMLKIADVKEVWSVRGRLTTAFDYVLLLNHQKFSKLETEIIKMKERIEAFERILTRERHSQE